MDVARNFEIGKAYFASVQGESRDYVELSGVLDRRGLQPEFLQAGDMFEISGVRIEILYPSATEAALTENDRSLVIALSYGDRQFLMTGDIEKEAERRLVSSDRLKHFDVVKVPHHGSRTSSTQEFVDATRPEIAVIPVGRRSAFGHPHSEVVNRWQSNGARVMRTGDGGMITITTDGTGLEITTFLFP